PDLRGTVRPIHRDLVIHRIDDLRAIAVHLHAARRRSGPGCRRDQRLWRLSDGRTVHPASLNRCFPPSSEWMVLRSSIELLIASRLATPSVLVDLNRVSGLEYARFDGDTLELGAMTRHRSVQELPGLRERCPMIAEGVDLIGHPAIRNRGTVGGSLAHADPAA